MEPLWVPSSARIADAFITDFQNAWQAELCVRFDDYFAMHSHSVERAADFWEFYLNYSRLPTAGSYAEVMSGEMPSVLWFAGLTTNYARAALYPPNVDADDLAIIATNESDAQTSLTYGELRRQVAQCAQQMRSCGVQRGDRVAAFVCNTPHAVIILLACAALGAVFSSCSPDFGFAAAHSRFGQIRPTMFFAHSGYFYNGKYYDTTETVRQLCEHIGSVRRTVMISGNGDSADEWTAFLNEAGAAPPLEFAELDFNAPLYILFSSGTTGKPKAIVHRLGGVMLKHHSEHRLHSNIGRGSRVLYFTTCGWMMWNWQVSALLQGTTLLLADGSPTFPNAETFWRRAARLRADFIGVGSRFIHHCIAVGISLAAEMNENLQTVAATGSPLSVAGYEWVYQHIKTDVHLAAISGGTDIVGCFFMGCPTLPVYAGQMQCATMGVDAAVFDEHGKAVTQTAGELVCRSPLPSMPVGFWDDDDGARYGEAYFSHYPGVWRHGDMTEQTAQGGYIIHGRSDATLNPGGVRIGTAEIYQVLENVDGVGEAAAVAKKLADDEEIWLFVVLRPGAVWSEALAQRIRDAIRADASPRHIPKRIFPVSQLPQTRSGKITELAIAQIINGGAVGNREVMSNPQALDEIARACVGQ